jgi:4,5-DOPA dioxygenase extradiol
MNSISEFNKYHSGLKENGENMPALFIGHGSPYNGIENNEFSQGWKDAAAVIPKPKAVIVISAHWLTYGTHITAMEHPRIVPEGFPRQLLDAVQYDAHGDPGLAKETAGLILSTNAGLNHDWGLDHGAWMLVRQMYPDADIPVLQLSIDYTKDAKYHYDLAKQLISLRKKGVLLIGSGNMVHNLRMIDWDLINGGGYDWAFQINDKFKELIKDGKHNELIKYRALGKEAELAIPTPDHYFPLMYILALKEDKDDITFFNDKVVGGSLTMTSLIAGR